MKHDTRQHKKRAYMESLWFDPFQGDFGNVGDRLLENKLVICQKQSVCSNCDKETVIGNVNRIQKEIVESENGFVSYRWCQECLDAMIHDLYGNGDLFYKRSSNYQSLVEEGE